MLHLTISESPDDSDEKRETISTVPFNTVTTHSSSYLGGEYIMLATAVLHAYDNQSSHKPCHVLLDYESQANFISRTFLSVLGLEMRSSNISISGINHTVTTVSQIAKVRLQSRINTFNVTINCIVTDQITDKLPIFTLKRGAFDIPRNLQLADLQFHVSSDIDILIDTGVFWQILRVGQVKASSTHPTLQKTRLG